MKLAEALILRADCQKRLEQLKQRLSRNAMVQEGDEPAENPQILLNELERVSNQLSDLIKKINRTNSVSKFGDGMTISDALAERNALLIRRSAFDDLVQAASVVQNRFLRSEVKFKSTINVAELQARVDDLSKRYRELDSRVQEANWTIELED